MTIQYWRMQLHPDYNTFSSFFAHTSIAKGFIGLDFKNNVGDLLELKDISILGSQDGYLPFATEMKVGDIVLIVSHNKPIAVVKVISNYNYIREILPEIDVWFRHFRKIDKNNIIYYSDYEIHLNDYQEIKMRGTIEQLKSDNGQSIQLIKKMIEWEKSKNPESIY